MPEFVKRESRYFETSLINFNGKKTFGLFEPPQWIRALTNDQLYNLSIPSEFEGRPDLISNRLYGSPNLYWVILWINQPLQPFGWPKAGSIIRYVSPEVVNTSV